MLSSGCLETSEFAARGFDPLDAGTSVYAVSPCTYVRWQTVGLDADVYPLCYEGRSTFTPRVSLNHWTNSLEEHYRLIHPGLLIRPRL